MVRLLYFPLNTFLGYGRNPLSTSSDRSCHNSDLRAPLMRGFILRVSCIDLGGPEGCAAGQSGVVMHALVAVVCACMPLQPWSLCWCMEQPSSHGNGRGFQNRSTPARNDNSKASSISTVWGRFSILRN